MPKQWIKNFKRLATTPFRQKALEIMEAGLSAVDTKSIIQKTVQLQGSLLTIKNQQFDLGRYKKIQIIGFGKASCAAAAALEAILGDYLQGGEVISTEVTKHKRVEAWTGTHPVPSAQNVQATKKILELSQQAAEDDLVLVVVSGGGSALLCWPQEECEQGQRLYQKFLATPATIQEINTVRKHISRLKGGGLAKELYPATVIGLIFSDVPGGYPEVVASGSTFKDSTTVYDAKAIIDKYNLGNFKLNETPKQDQYFEKVTNILLASNETALAAMVQKVKDLGLEPRVFSSEIYEDPQQLIPLLFSLSRPGRVILGGGEPSLQVPENSGQGGRNTHLALSALPFLKQDQVFISLASDGIDNSPAAGAMADWQTRVVSQQKGLDYKQFLTRFDSYNFFKTTDDLILTGPTGTNVADLMLLLQASS